MLGVDFLRGDRREIDRERRPLAFALALGQHRAAVQNDQVVHECEADTEATVTP